MAGDLNGYHPADTAAAQNSHIPADWEQLRRTEEAVAVGVVACEPAAVVADAVYGVIALSAVCKLVHQRDDSLLVWDGHVETAEAFKKSAAACNILGSYIYELVGGVVKPAECKELFVYKRGH